MIETMAVADSVFDNEFKALLGPSPFIWQRRLFQSLMEEDVPSGVLPAHSAKKSRPRLALLRIRVAETVVPGEASAALIPRFITPFVCDGRDAVVRRFF
ncbi:MAG TPA: hypothetical protein VME66_03415 [Candidatus Acidoferrales bacterium]|nr:hypothetical protein [Candidatus Acidoferrales bacterium]